MLNIHSIKIYNQLYNDIMIDIAYILKIAIIIIYNKIYILYSR